MELNKDNLKTLPLALAGLVFAAVDVMIVQEIKRYRDNLKLAKYIGERMHEPWEEEFFDGNEVSNEPRTSVF